MIVDDSSLVRQSLKSILELDPEIEVISSAGDPIIAMEKLKIDTPDVIMLDIEMPRMDGITFLKMIMNSRPIPVIICSSLAGKGTHETISALEFGAVDIITKPKMGLVEFFEESKILIIDSVKAASKVRFNLIAGKRNHPGMNAIVSGKEAGRLPEQTAARGMEKIIAVGASTGGTEALRIFLQGMPAGSPGMVIVQHMPEYYTMAFAQRLNGLCSMEVKEASDQDDVLRGRALIAPGNMHTIIKRSGTGYKVEVKDGPLVSRHRPSVNMLFRSAAKLAGPRAIGVIMTGMGDDGAQGMLEMKNAGAYTIAQDEGSCVVFGMPMEAIKLGAVKKILPLGEIAGEVLRNI